MAIAARRLSGAGLFVLYLLLPVAAIAQTNVLAATWNGRPTRFISDVVGVGNDQELVLRGEVQERDGLRTFAITVGEQEGGTPEIAAIGFANADRDGARELIVLLRWHIRHYEVSGDMYDVRIFDDLQPGARALPMLAKPKALFPSYECDCSRRDGGPQRARFSTIASIKARLTRAGY